MSILYVLILEDCVGLQCIQKVASRQISRQITESCSSEATTDSVNRYRESVAESKERSGLIFVSAQTLIEIADVL
jgi:hypothetical protein